MTSLAALALVGLLAQLIDGSLGMAYGVTSTSLLLFAGFAPATASASVHLAEVGTTLASGVSHWRFGNVDWRLVLRLGAPGAVGAFLGASVLSSLSTETAKPVTAGILLIIGIYLLFRFVRRSEASRRYESASTLRSRFLTPLGLIAGFIDATGGGGWGPVATPTLLVRDRVEPRKVIGSVDASEFMVAFAASVGFLVALGRQGVSLPTVAALLAGGLVAAPLAAWLVRHIPARLLGVSVGGVLVLTNVRTLFGTFDVVPDVRVWSYGVVILVWAVAASVALRGVVLERTERPGSGKDSAPGRSRAIER